MKTNNSSVKPTFRQWKLFTLAVEKGSLLGAAAAGDTDPALVCRAIKNLEHTLQEPLLDRSRSGVRPTWLGAKKYVEAVEVLNELDALLNKPAEENAQTASIRLAVPSALASLFAKPLAEFEKLSSAERVRIEFMSYQNFNEIRPENFDLIICVQNLPNLRLVAYDIASISYGIFASPDFLSQHKNISDPVELEQLPLIHRKSEKVLLHGPKQSLTISVEPQIRVNSDQTMISSAVEGLGVAVVTPLWAAEPFVKDRHLIRILPDWQPPSSPVWLLRHPGKKLATLEKLIPFLREIWSFHPTLSKAKKLDVPCVTENH